VVSENATIEIAVLNEPTASPASALREDVMSAVSRAVHATHPDIPIIPYMAAYGTDGKWTRIAGMPTYGVSGLLIQPNDDFSHGLNERVPVRSFYSALEHWHILLTELAGR
jgi:acetylornithine deacetylase/succinyl-diaminopimelate desuccinylase-like protein